MQTKTWKLMYSNQRLYTDIRSFLTVEQAKIRLEKWVVKLFRNFRVGYDDN